MDNYLFVFDFPFPSQPSHFLLDPSFPLSTTGEAAKLFLLRVPDHVRDFTLNY